MEQQQGTQIARAGNSVTFEPKQPPLTPRNYKQTELTMKTITAGQSMLSTQNPSSVINAYEPRCPFMGPFHATNGSFGPVSTWRNCNNK